MAIAMERQAENEAEKVQALTRIGTAAMIAQAPQSEAAKRVLELELELIAQDLEKKLKRFRCQEPGEQ
jgi:hypothetical protein